MELSKAVHLSKPGLLIHGHTHPGRGIIWRGEGRVELYGVQRGDSTICTESTFLGTLEHYYPFHLYF